MNDNAWITLRNFQRVATMLASLVAGAALCPTAAAADPTPTQVAGRALDQWASDLDSDNEIVALRAVKTLGAFGPPAAGPLSKALASKNAGVRYWAASNLGNIGVVAGDGRASLVQMMYKDASPAVQMAAAYAVCRIDVADPPNQDSAAGLKLLIGRLAHGERGMANSAAEFLGRLGPAAAAAIPALEEATRHKDYHIWGAAKDALRKIRAKD